MAISRIPFAGKFQLNDPSNVERWRKAEIEHLERTGGLMELMRKAEAEARAAAGIPASYLQPKPRLTLKHHVWSCRTGTHLVDMCIGYGYTARQAYDDWRQRWVRTGH